MLLCEILSIKIMKTSGENTHPCRRPTSIRVFTIIVERANGCQWSDNLWGRLSREPMIKCITVLSICQALSKCKQVGQLFWPKATLSIVSLQKSSIDFWREAQQSNESAVGALPPVLLFEDGDSNCRLPIHSSCSFRPGYATHSTSRGGLQTWSSQLVFDR